MPVNNLLIKNVFFKILTVIWWIVALSYFANAIGMYMRGYFYPSILFFTTSIILCPLVAKKIGAVVKLNPNIIQIITLLLNAFLIPLFNKK